MPLICFCAALGYLIGGTTGCAILTLVSSGIICVVEVLVAANK